MNEWMNEWMNEEEEVQCNEIRSNNKKGQIQQKKKKKEKKLTQNVTDFIYLIFYLFIFF